MTQRTEREKLTLAARAGGKKIRIYEGMIIEPGTDCLVLTEDGMKWSPRTNAHQAADLMLRIGAEGISGTDVKDWMQRVFDAAVYQGSLMEVTEE